MKKNLKFSTKQNLNTYLQIEIKTFFDRQKTPDTFNTNQLTHQAWRAQIGSISATSTLQPSPFRADAQPFPTWSQNVAKINIKQMKE